jgi:hypothetical protein
MVRGAPHHGAPNRISDRVGGGHVARLTYV